MSKRYPRAKWPLPDIVHPENSVCYRVLVPDNTYYISAFMGSLATLGSAISWADDSGHTAVEVANVWREIADNLEECGIMDVRQGLEDKCILEKTTDNETWEQFADLSLCPPKIRRNSGILEWFDGSNWIPLPGGNDERFTGTFDPAWPEGTVPPGQTAQCLAATNIYTQYYQSFLQVNDFFTVGKLASEAVLVISGIIAIFVPVEFAVFEFLTLMLGAFTEGGDAVADLISEDTLEVLLCALDCHALADGSFDALGFAGVLADVGTGIEPGLTQAVVLFWLNSLGPVGLSRMANASGPTSGDCADCGCEGATWSQEFDFTVSDGGFHQRGGDPWLTATWVSGQGWTTNEAPYELAIDRAFDHASNITYGEIDWSTDAPDHSCNGSQQLIHLAVFGEGIVFDVCDVGTLDGHRTGTCDINVTTSQNLGSNPYCTGGTYFTIKRIFVSGTGINPFD